MAKNFFIGFTSSQRRRAQPSRDREFRATGGFISRKIPACTGTSKDPDFRIFVVPDEKAAVSIFVFRPR